MCNEYEFYSNENLHSCVHNFGSIMRRMYRGANIRDLQEGAEGMRRVLVIQSGFYSDFIFILQFTTIILSIFILPQLTQIY